MGLEYKHAIKDIAAINTSQYSKDDDWDEILYLDTGNITRGVIGDLQKFSTGFDKIPSRCKRKIKNGSIIYSMVRPNHRHFGILSNPPENMLVSTGFSVIDANIEIVEPEYLYYALTTIEATDHFSSLAEQSASTYPTLSTSDLGSYAISLPSLNQQRAVVACIRSIDDKILVNHSINDYLAA